jgi:hypothetical protein
MKITLVTQNDYCKEVLIVTTPVEFLILNKALKLFVKNKNNNDTDIKIAKRMNETKLEIKEVGE